MESGSGGIPDGWTVNVITQPSSELLSIDNGGEFDDNTNTNQPS